MEMKSSTWCNLKTIQFRNVHGVSGFPVGAQINLQNLGGGGGGILPPTFVLHRPATIHSDIFCHETNIVYRTKIIYDTFTYAPTNMGKHCF